MPRITNHDEAEDQNPFWTTNNFRNTVMLLMFIDEAFAEDQCRGSR